MPQDTPQSQIFRPAIAPSRSGGLLIIGYDGSRLAIPDSEVESLIEDMQAVRRKQLVQDCKRICCPVRMEVVE